MSMKINKLEIENVKRVKAVKIEPTANGLTIIGGNNNQGNNNQGNNNKGDNVNKPGTPNNTNAAGKNNTTNKGTVKTGDTAPFMAMIVTILAAAGVIFGTVAQKTRRRRNRK